jgi:hypothetical protein
MRKVTLFFIQKYLVAVRTKMNYTDMETTLMMLTTLIVVTTLMPEIMHGSCKKSKDMILFKLFAFYSRIEL